MENNERKMLRAPTKRSAGRVAKSIVNYFFLVLLAVFFLFPFFVILTRSLMSAQDVMTLPAKILPPRVTLQAYRSVFTKSMFTWLANTLIIMVLNMIGTPLTASMCAYPFAKMQFKGKEICFGAILATMMLPGIVIQIPSYIIFNRLRLINTPLPLVLPAFFGGGAVTIFLFRQYMRTIPDDLLSAARLDGATTAGTYLGIVLPICKPIIVYTLVTTFLSVWNDFMGPLLYLKDASSYTLALGIYYRFQGELTDINRANVQMATGVLMILPCAAVFLLFQKQLIEGVAVGGIKG